MNHASLKIFLSIAADAYNHTDSEFLKSENTQNRDAGSTASTAILVGDRLLVANVGDSRAVICRGGTGKIQKNYWLMTMKFRFLLNMYTYGIHNSDTIN